MLKKLQAEHKIWAEYNFGKIPSSDALIGVVEEIGELAHSHLKENEGIRTNEDHTHLAKDAVGDAVIYLSHYCTTRGWDFEEVVKTAWDEVKQRDWKKFPENGISK